MPTQRITGTGDTRMAARKVPSIRAQIADTTVNLMVIQNASISTSSYLESRSTAPPFLASRRFVHDRGTGAITGPALAVGPRPVQSPVPRRSRGPKDRCGHRPRAVERVPGESGSTGTRITQYRSTVGGAGSGYPDGPTVSLNACSHDPSAIIASIASLIWLRVSVSPFARPMP